LIVVVPLNDASHCHANSRVYCLFQQQIVTFLQKEQKPGSACYD